MGTQRQKAGRNLLTPAENHRPLDDIFKFADIARPLVGEEEIEGGLLKAVAFAAGAIIVRLVEGIHAEQDMVQSRRL